MLSRALEVIDRNALAQVRLIDDMLDTARIMSGKLRLESQPVDLARIALAAIDVVAPTAAAKQVTIVSSPASGVMPMLGDPDRLQQIVWNLLANAIKFTPSGGRVSIGLERGADTLQLSVDDSGEGISPEFLPHLFKRFQQADPSSNRRHAGLGLGLSLVRQLVELHGGRIGVTSTVGVGSTFTVTFPSRPELDRLAGGGADGRPPANAMLSNIRVLVVADDPDSRDLLTAALDHHGAQVEAVPSADEGLALIAASHYPHVLVASFHDADPDAALIRALETLSTGAGAMIPAIAVTPKEHPEQTADLLAAGYRIHLAQPLSPPALVSAVLRLAGPR
jgi:CheY-like chemotaxis protein